MSSISGRPAATSPWSFVNRNRSEAVTMMMSPKSRKIMTLSVAVFALLGLIGTYAISSF
jgi:hypothetical protein